MSETSEFFKELEADRVPLLEHLSGSVRFDLMRDGRTEHWLVQIQDGDVEVSHKAGNPDCVARMEASTFEAMTRGELNAIAAAFRGDLDIEGQPAILLAFQRLFPGPPSDRERLATAGRTA